MTEVYKSRLGRDGATDANRINYSVHISPQLYRQHGHLTYTQRWCKYVHVRSTVSCVCDKSHITLSPQDNNFEMPHVWWYQVKLYTRYALIGALWVAKYLWAVWTVELEQMIVTMAECWVLCYFVYTDWYCNDTNLSSLTSCIATIRTHFSENVRSHRSNRSSRDGPRSSMTSALYFPHGP
jgi:hypothetical protein